MGDALDDGELSLEMTGRVMEFDVEGNMIVNYSERLVPLLRDTRQLSELGLAVPDRVKKAAADAEKYYRFGIMLKKVANFYNTMGSQIIPSQKPMLLEPLLEFESAVQKPTPGSKGGVVTWSDPEQCQAFVTRLQAAADHLAAENRALRKMHQRLGEEVVALMGVDLLRQREVRLCITRAVLASVYCCPGFCG
jgi:dynein heavy chain 2, cytosolic